MKRLSAIIKPNPFYWSPPGVSTLTRAFEILKNDFSNISFIYALMSYPKQSFLDVDLLSYLEKETLDQLRNESIIFIFDATFEGFSPLEKPIAKSLYQSCIKNNINPKKIFYFTGNFLDNSADINIIPIFILDDKSSWQGYNLSNIEQSKHLCEMNYQKILLSLSRRNRRHRVFAHLALFNSELRNDSIISQDIITNYIFNEYELKIANVTSTDLDLFKKNLPLIADENNFHINDPFNSLANLHSKTLFSIVNETLANNVCNTTLFFSEKILKPILNFQPMIIYGQQGINKKLSMLGFKTYEEYFNLDFDDESDDLIRYMKLLDSVKATVNMLKLYSRDEQIAWRYRYEEVLTYNYNVIVGRKNTNDQLLKFESKLRELFNLTT